VTTIGEYWSRAGTRRVPLAVTLNLNQDFPVTSPLEQDPLHPRSLNELIRSSSYEIFESHSLLWDTPRYTSICVETQSQILVAHLQGQNLTCLGVSCPVHAHRMRISASCEKQSTIPCARRYLTYNVRPGTVTEADFHEERAPNSKIARRLVQWYIFYNSRSISILTAL
jgi:hypothetical protein